MSDVKRNPYDQDEYEHGIWADGAAAVVDLVDDLAHVLASTVVGWESIIGHDLAEAPEVKRVMARYRAAKEFLPR
jgi:hypothetical protein